MDWSSIAIAAPAAFLLGVIVGYAARAYFAERKRKELAAKPSPKPPATRKKAAP